MTNDILLIIKKTSHLKTVIFRENMIYFVRNVILKGCKD